MSDQSSPQKPNQNRRRKNYRHKKRNHNTGEKTSDNARKKTQASKQASDNSTSHNKTDDRQNNRNRNKKNHSRNRRPKTLSPSRILQKYDNLLEQHISARKKYYEFYARAKGKHLEKIIHNFDKTLNDLNRFVSGLKDWQKETLDQKINLYPEDRQYSKEHDLSPQGDQVSFVGDFEDPHLLPSQKDKKWSEDTEETTGTIEDYLAYKESTR